MLTEGGHTLKCKRRNFSCFFDVISSCRYVTYFEFIGVMLKSFSMIDNIVTSKWGKISSMYNEYLIPCGTVQKYLNAKLRGVGEQVRKC